MEFIIGILCGVASGVILSDVKPLIYLKIKKYRERRKWKKWRKQGKIKVKDGSSLAYLNEKRKGVVRKPTEHEERIRKSLGL